MENHALTGDFESMLRFRAKYRNQLKSLLGKNAYRTGAALVDYNFKYGKYRYISLGTFGLTDQAGQVNFRVNKLQLRDCPAVEKLLGNPEVAHPFISVGMGGGVGVRKLDGDKL